MSELGPSPVSAKDRQLTVAQARERMAHALQPVSGTQRLTLNQALGRVLAADLISPINVPAYDNSAMDGYALHGADLPTQEQAQATFKVSHSACQST
mgnify:CR=1 FL=1